MASTGKLIEKKGLEALFGQWEKEMNGASKSSLHQLRQQALKDLLEADYPTTKHEEWKYTNLNKVLQSSWEHQASHQVTEAEVKDLLFTSPEEVQLFVFVNGQLQAGLSDMAQVGAAVAMPLTQAYQEHTALVEAHLGKYAVAEGHAFTALSTAFASEGAFIHVPKSKHTEKPIVLLHINDTRKAQPMTQPRHLITVEENAQASIVEQFVSIGDGESFTNAVTEITVASYANVDHYKLQVEGEKSHYVGTTQVAQEGQSYFANTTISLSGGIIRNNLNIALNGEHSEAYMNGLYMLDGTTHVDNHTAIDHKKANCYSNELYKGIVDGASRGVFNGKIFVRQDAQKTNAFQSNNNIVLSDRASIDTKPQLEIWADDVKCSHGATVGALDEQPLFYLRSRGIPKSKARSLLMYAFAEDALERIKIESIHQYVNRIISKRLGYEF